MAYRIFISSVQREFAKERRAQVMLFPDRLEVTNPGPLPKGMTVAKLKRRHKSMPVNPLLAQAMYLRGYIERVGSGTGDIIERCREKGLPLPIWENEDDGFTVTLRRITSGSSEERSLQTTRKTTPETTIETTIENLGEGTRAVYDALVTSPTSNLEQIAEKTGMTKDGVFYHVKVLRKELGLRHEGPTKKGRWVFDRKGKRR